MQNCKHRRILPRVLRFLGFWAGIAGGYATMGSTCPCCGRPAGKTAVNLVGRVTVTC